MTSAARAGHLPVIAIDGPAAAGKSTVARGVADRLGMTFFDTGLLYRAVTFEALRRGTPLDDGESLAELTRGMVIDLDPEGGVLIDGIEVTAHLRTPEVDASVSQVSAQPAVRQALFAIQRTIAERSRVVMVGRDITTVVVPDAAVRIYLDASPEERARRRYLEQAEKGGAISEEAILAEMRERDRKDSTRETAPLQAANGVTVVNTDGLTLANVIDTVSAIAMRKLDNATTSHARHFEFETAPKFSRKRRVAQVVCGSLLSLITGMRSTGNEHIPRAGPLLVVSNHLHIADPAIEYFLFPRALHFMGKKELFEVPILGWAARASGGFPVDRGRFDREAIKQAEDRLAGGIAVGMFPEGGRSITGSLAEGKPGAGLLALRTGAPILPVAITGTERLPFNGPKGNAQRKNRGVSRGFQKVRLVFGEPFTIPGRIGDTKTDAATATEIIMLEVARLLPEAYRGVYAKALRSETDRRIVPYSGSS